MPPRPRKTAPAAKTAKAGKAKPARKAGEKAAAKPARKAAKTPAAKPLARPARAPAPPPPAMEKPVRRIVHGCEIIDEFAWLRAKNWRKVLRDPAALPRPIRAFLDAENAYCEAVLKPTQALRKTLAKEMRARIKEDDSEPPTPDGPWTYYSRYVKRAQHPLICRRPRAGGREQVMLDCEALAKGKPFFDLAAAVHSPCHNLLAWSADARGSEYHVVRVRDLGKGRDLRDVVRDADGDVVWTADSSAFFYVKMDENHRPCRVYLHRLGERQDEDQLVHEEREARWFVRIGETQSGDYMTIEVEDHETAETRLVDLRAPLEAPRVVEPRAEKVRYDVDHHGDKLFILTNADGAEDFKIVEAPLAAPGRANWRDVTPHKCGRMITGCVAFARHLVRTELENGLPRIVIRRLKDGAEHSIAFDEEAYDLDLEDVLEFDVNAVRFGYSSMTRPYEVWAYDMETRARSLLKRQVIPSGHKPERYVTRRIEAKGHDGAVIPVTLLYARKTKIDGKAPLLLEAYGSYGDAFEAHFSSSRFSLVDRGFVYAIAHVRGGADKGWRWYLDGKLEKKPNTFHDYISAARALIAKRFTAQGRIVGLGGSAGGMLMGAVANMAPELFAGIIADVPFVDVLNTMLDDSLPLTPPEWLEWGNPITDEAAFHTILSYSPYDNVRAQAYPPMLIEGGLTDPRVTYWEPAKFAARLRARMTGGGPILLRTNMDAGHGGASGRFDRLGEIAVEHSFALWAAQRAKRARPKKTANKRKAPA
jgi:oligopeptidase B